MIIDTPIGVALSIMCNALLGGKPHEPLSARSYRSDWGIAKVIDRFTSPGHCRRSFIRSQAAEKARWAVPTKDLIEGQDNE